MSAYAPEHQETIDIPRVYTNDAISQKNIHHGCELLVINKNIFHFIFF